MKTFQILTRTSSKQMNESFEKTFGSKLNLEGFSLTQLEDARNRLRTKISQVRAEANFNETIENEDVTKTQWMLDIINKEISERTEQQVDESDPAEMFKGIDIGEASPGDDDDMAKDTDYDDKDSEYDDEDGEPRGSYDSSDDAEALASAGFGSDEDYGHYGDDESFGIYDSYDFNTGQPIGESMKKINESELNKASAVVSAKSMVDKVSRWIEELAGMENDTLLTLGDSIRDEMGQEQAKQFLSTVAPSIQAALDTLKTARETMASGVRGLTGEEQSAEMIGAEPEGGMGAEPAADSMADAGADSMNDADAANNAELDNFAAAEPAAGGLEAAGREKRESINRQTRLMNILAG